ncbi:MAG TPA: OmpA family protein [Candidatus Bathyarchaeia archaeon]|nr:OmpA family protein [Candidatus Bathyarchaeia archaeon]
MQKNLLILLITALSFVPACKKQEQKQKNKKKSDSYAFIDIPLTEDVTVEDILEEPAVLSFFEDDDEDEFDDMPVVEEIEFVMNDEQEPVFIDEPVQQLVWEVQEEEKEFKAIYFEFDKYAANDDQEEAIASDVETIKNILKNDDSGTVVIEGHACHSAGSPAYNVALSEKRAKSIADKVAEEGIDSTHIKVVAYGQERPAIIDGKQVTGSREEQWKNRRVELKVING